MITSAQNSWIKLCRKLRQKKVRQDTGLFCVDGAHALLLALDHGFEITRVFFSHDSETDSHDSIKKALKHKGIPCDIILGSLFSKISYGNTHEGLLALVKGPLDDFTTLPLKEDTLLPVLDQVEKPGNIGAVLRTADAVGSGGLCVSDPVTDLWNANIVRASLGTCFTLPYFSAQGADLRDWLLEHHFQCVALTPEASQTYLDIEWQNRIAVIGGSEHAGLSETWRHPSIQPVAIPMHGKADSLNVSVAMTVILYEILRRRQTHI